MATFTTPTLTEDECAALARARASMAFEGYPMTDEQAAATVAFVQENGLLEKGVEALKLPVEESLAALDRAWEEARAAEATVTRS